MPLDCHAASRGNNASDRAGFAGAVAAAIKRVGGAQRG